MKKKYLCFKAEDFDYLCKRINWGDSFIDAKAARILNKPRVEELEDKDES